LRIFRSATIQRTRAPSAPLTNHQSQRAHVAYFITHHLTKRHCLTMHRIVKTNYHLVPAFFFLLLAAVGKKTVATTNNNDGRGEGGDAGIARATKNDDDNNNSEAAPGEELPGGGNDGVPKAIQTEERIIIEGDGDLQQRSATSSSLAITKAIEYLHENQVKADRYRPFDHEWEGNFPQFFRFLPTAIFGVLGNIPDISPFIVALIHDGLAEIVESNHAALQLEINTTKNTYQMAREMRTRAAKFMKRFQSVPSDTRAQDIKEVGTFGFWPKDRNPDWPQKSEHAKSLFDNEDYITERGVYYGDRVPVNPSFMWPHIGAVPPDADDTSLVLAALLDHQEIDGGNSLMDLGADGVYDDAIDFATFFADWRDVGEFATVTDQTWKQASSGAFVTWFNYQNSSVTQDVDLAVNANILYLLGRTGKQDTPGFDEAVQLINGAAEQGLHRTEDPHGTRLTDATFIDISYYYTNNHHFQYYVSRAYNNGGVTSLQPAIQVFVDDLLKEAIRGEDGSNLVHWDLGHGAPIVNTAFAVLILVNVLEAKTELSSSSRLVLESWQHDTVLLEELIQHGGAWLVQQQTEQGDWEEESVAFYGSNWPRIGAEWISRSWTTSTALQAIARSMVLLHNADAMSTRTKTIIP
jgi:hypothetical protein